MRDAAVFLDEGDGHCSGTVVAKHMVLTAGHCLPGPGGNVSVVFRDGERRVAKTKWQHGIVDVALLEFDGDSAKVSATINCKPLELGEPFYWIGNPSMLR